MHSDILSTIYTLLANNTDNNVDSSTNNSPYTLMEKFYDLLPSIAIIDADNYKTHFEQLKNFTHHISQIMTDEAISKVSIGVGGGFSAGKSRFINTLIDMDVLPEALEPCTAVATYLTHNDDDTIQALNIFNTAVDVEQAQLKHLRHFIGDDSENSLHISQIIKHVTINTPQIKWQNITFLDTPGYSKADADDSIVNDENLALSQLSAVDHIVWLVSAKNGTIRDEDIQFLHRLNPKNPVFIVITQSDLVNQVETDIPLIMQGINKHLEDAHIPLAGMMAWAAPAYTDEGTLIAGDDIRHWLDVLNKDEVETKLLETLDYCNQLSLIATNKIAELNNENSEDEHNHLIEVLSHAEQQISQFKYDITNLSAQHHVFDWDFAEMYASSNVANDVDKAVEIYKSKVLLNTDKAINKLNGIVKRTNELKPIKALADIYEKQLEQDNVASKYHCFLIIKHPDNEQASKSWQWLWSRAKTNEGIFTDLYHLVKDVDDNDSLYQFSLLADERDQAEIALKIMIRLAKRFHDGALSYLESKSINDNGIKLKLAEIYKSSQLLSYKKKSIAIFTDLAKQDNTKAFKRLEDLTQVDSVIGLLAIESLADVYEKQFEQDESASKYHCMLLDKHAQSEQAKASWKWLTNKARINDAIFLQLQHLVMGLDNKNYTYKFATLAGELERFDICIQQMFKLANEGYGKADEYLNNRSKNDEVFAFKLGVTYKEGGLLKYQKKAVNIFGVLAVKGNQRALSQLEDMVHIDKEIGLISLLKLTKIYEEDINKATDYHIEIIKEYDGSPYEYNSINWLFEYTKTNNTVFEKLYELILVLDKPEYDYKLGVLLEEQIKDGRRSKEKLESLAYSLLIRAAQAYYRPAVDWLSMKSKHNPELKLELASVYDKHATKENKVKSLDIYNELAHQGNETAISRLDRIVSERTETSGKAIHILANIYDKTSPNKSSWYHKLMIERYPEIPDAQKSWDWLFAHAVNNEAIFMSLKALVDKQRSSDIRYKMIKLSDSLQRHDTAVEYAIDSALTGHLESKKWLLKKAKNKNHPAKNKLFDLYTAGNKNNKVNEIIYQNLLERIIEGDDTAFGNLSKLAHNKNDYNAMWLLSLCYMYGKSTRKNDEKAQYWLEQSAMHIESARYNLNVIRYQQLKALHPLSWIIHLFLLFPNRLFEDLGAPKYLIYSGVIIPNFIGLDYEVSYRTNTKAIIIYTVFVFAYFGSLLI